MEMTPEEWVKAKELFNAALALEPSKRAGFLMQACPNATLRQEVEKLLINFQEAGSFLSDYVLHPHSRIPRQTSETRAEHESTRLSAGSREFLSNVTSGERNDFLIGRHLGVYELRRRIGQGGMAAVFLAYRADGEFHRQVPIKLVLPGLDSNE